MESIRNASWGVLEAPKRKGMKFLYVFRGKISSLIHQTIKSSFPIVDCIEIGKINSKDLIEQYDFVIIFGVTSKRVKFFAEEANVGLVFIDKSHIRTCKFRDLNQDSFLRITVNSWNPFKHYERFENRWGERSNIIQNYDGLKPSFYPNGLAPFNREGSGVLFVGSSEKYHKYHKLPEPTEYAQSVMKQIKKYTDMEIIYRPKRTWRGKVPIYGTKWEGKGRDFYELISRVNPSCIVTHGSGACIDAMYLGYPAIILGDAATKPISSTEIGDINNPYLASDLERKKLANSLGFFNWKIREMRDGLMWNELKPIFEEEMKNVQT